MEFKNITINRTNVLDIDCITKQLAELYSYIRLHKHKITDITDFPTTVANENKILSVINNELVWINNPALPPVTGNAGKYLSNNGIIPVWLPIPLQLQSDWNQSNNTLPDFIKNKPDLSVYATIINVNTLLANKVDKVSGKQLSSEDYTTLEKSKLAGVAPNAEVNVQSDWNQTTNTDDSFIKNKPTQLSNFINDLGFLSSVSWSIITGKPIFAPVATSGNYVDLINKPIIPSTTGELTNNSGFITLADIPTQRFSADIPVVLSGGKTIGRYSNGQTIPALNKTAQEVITLISQEPINPTLTLTSSTSIQFNQISISNVLNFTRVINSLNGVVSSANLEWRRNNTGAWISLSTITTNGSFTHSLTDSAFNTQSFNYRYTVTDNIGGTATIFLDLSPQSYVNPSISFSALGVVLSPESQNIRELGNTTSTLQGSTSRNSPLVNILNYKFQVSVNGAAYIDLTSNVSLSSTGGSFTNLSNTPATSTTTSVTYRVIVTDSYTTTSATYTINYKSIIYYGDINVSTTLNSAAIRSLPYKRFIDDGSPFTFVTGVTNRRFIVAWDTTRGLTQALDTNNNVDLTAVFITNSFTVNNAAGDPLSYNNLVYTNALQYNPQITIRITYI